MTISNLYDLLRPCMVGVARSSGVKRRMRERCGYEYFGQSLDDKMAE